MEAGVAGAGTARTMGLVQLLRSTKRHEDLKFSNTPAAKPTEPTSHMKTLLLVLALAILAAERLKRARLLGLSDFVRDIQSML